MGTRVALTLHHEDGRRPQHRSDGLPQNESRPAIDDHIGGSLAGRVAIPTKYPSAITTLAAPASQRTLPTVAASQSVTRSIDPSGTRRREWSDQYNKCAQLHEVHEDTRLLRDRPQRDCQSN